MSFGAVAVVAALTGFVALSYEVLWYRVFSYVSWSSPAAFGLVLGAYLVGLANGALRARRLCAPGGAFEGVGDPVARLGAFLLAANVVGWAVIPLTARLATWFHWLPALLAVAVATTFLGAVLPLLSHVGIAADDRAGARLSYLYVANIVGSAAGSLSTGFVLLDRLPLRTLALGLFLVGAALAAALVAVAHRRRGLAAMVVATVAVVLLTPRAFDQLWERLQWKDRWTPARRFSDVIENKSGVIVVTPDHVVYSNGIYDGGFNTSLANALNMIERPWALFAMRAHLGDVFMIGLGSGSWAQVLAQSPAVDHLTVVEINPGYRDLVARHPDVASLLTNPKVTLVIDDGRRWLQRSGRRFDVILMNSGWHFTTFMSNLLSAEFLELCRVHLHQPDGVVFLNTTGSTDVIATALHGFRSVLGVGNMVAMSDGPLHFDHQRWAALIGEQPMTGVRRQNLIRFGEQVRERAQLEAVAVSAHLITDDNLYNEYHGTPSDRASPAGFFRLLLDR